MKSVISPSLLKQRNNLIFVFKGRITAIRPFKPLRVTRRSRAENALGLLSAAKAVRGMLKIRPAADNKSERR